MAMTERDKAIIGPFRAIQYQGTQGTLYVEPTATPEQLADWQRYFQACQDEKARQAAQEAKELPCELILSNLVVIAAAYLQKDGKTYNCGTFAI